MSTPQPQYAFGWQGGEPTLMGVDFFRRAVEFQQKHGSAGAVVGNGLQTNGVLIDDEMARLFHEYHFLLGISLDGTAEIHNHYRVKANGNGSHADVLRAIGRLQAHEVDFNILTLVSQSNVHHAAEVYQYLCEHDLLFHQYIPCAETDAERHVLPFSISGGEWGDFLCTIFDAWYPGDTRRVSIRLFDSIVTLLVDGVRNICHLGRNCCQYFVVEYNGDVYPCDFFVEKQLLLGNLTRDSWQALQTSPLYVDFGRQKETWHPACGECRFVHICSGDCLKHRFCSNGGDPRRLSHLCEGWQTFYGHTLERFQALAGEIRQERQQEARAAAARTTLQAGGRVGRNDPCPCGSGRKYKKCCGAAG